MEVNYAWPDWKIILEKAETFKKQNGRLPNYVDHKGYRVYLKDYQNPLKVTVNAIKIPTEPTITKPAVITALEKALNGKFTNATQMYNLFKNEIYSYYYNDKYDEKEELDRLNKNLGLNCSDVSQIGKAGIEGLNQMGKKYQVRYIRATFKCGGHVFLQIKGEEFGDTWTNYDLAGAMKYDYSIGKLMCSGSFWDVVVNPAWLLSDDGIT